MPTLIYKDVLSGEELFTDAYKKKDIDDVMYEVDCAMVTVKDGDNYNIGANPSAEDPGEQPMESSAKTVIDMLKDKDQTIGYMQYERDAWATQVTLYIKKLAKALKERGMEDAKVAEIQSNMKKYCKQVLVKKFKDLDPYSVHKSDDADPEGMFIYLNYREDGVTPYFLVWKYGVFEAKS